VDIIGMIDIRRWRDRWELWKQHRQRLIHCQRMRSDYLKIAGITPGIAAPWMNGEARLLMLSQKGVETVGSEPCQREPSY
jgi:hypothetical protein